WATVAGTLYRAGEVDFFRFTVTKGQQVGVQILTKEIGSKVEPLLTLLDAAGNVLAQSETGLLGYTFDKAGTYALGVRDRDLRGGPGMTYRLHVGELPVVTSIFPLGARQGTETEVRVEGVHLASSKVKVKVPVDA